VWNTLGKRRQFLIFEEIAAVGQENWPDWWVWELDCSNPHLAKRMMDRSFNEVDVRDMLERALSYSADAAAGRYVIQTTHLTRSWEVVVEPDQTAKILVVVTAYPVD
jgi:hypothetical protein